MLWSKYLVISSDKFLNCYIIERERIYELLEQANDSWKLLSRCMNESFLVKQSVAENERIISPFVKSIELAASTINTAMEITRFMLKISTNVIQLISEENMISNGVSCVSLRWVYILFVGRSRHTRARRLSKSSEVNRGCLHS